MESTDIGLALATDVGDVANLETQSKQLVGAVNEVKAMAEADTGEGAGIVPSNFVIAPSNAVNKERADLILTGVPADDLAAINNAVESLHTARGGNTDITIRIDFLGGNIDLGGNTSTNGSINVLYDNIHLYGNGVNITGYADGQSAVLRVIGSRCIVNGLNITNTGIYNDPRGLYINGGQLINCTATCIYGYEGIVAMNSIVINCFGTGGNYGISTSGCKVTRCRGIGTTGISSSGSTLVDCISKTGIYSNNSTLINCIGGDDEGTAITGIDVQNSTLINCTGNGVDFGIFVNEYSYCTLLCCDGTIGGIAVPAGFDGMHPNTLALLQAFNKGSITEIEIVEGP